MSATEQSKGVGGPAPFTQMWLYKFFYKYRERMTRYDESVIDHTLCAMDGENQTLMDSNASQKLKNATYQIVRRILTP